MSLTPEKTLGTWQRHTPDRLELLSGCVAALGLPCKAAGWSGRCFWGRCAGQMPVPKLLACGSLYSHWV